MYPLFNDTITSLNFEINLSLPASWINTIRRAFCCLTKWATSAHSLVAVLVYVLSETVDKENTNIY
jgi:hypothetical protein